MENDFDKALAELIDASDFIMRISGLPAEQMVEEVAVRAPSFIEYVEAMEAPPKNSLEFWASFDIWTIEGLCSKYCEIWDKVIDAYSCSGASKQLYEKYNLRDVVWSQIDKILKKSGF